MKSGPRPIPPEKPCESPECAAAEQLRRVVEAVETYGDRGTIIAVRAALQAAETWSGQRTPEVEEYARQVAADYGLDDVQTPQQPLAAELESACGSCGYPLTGDSGYTGAAAYHRECARTVYGERFSE